MRADRRIYRRASALPLHVLLAAKASPPRALLARMVRVEVQASCFQLRHSDSIQFARSSGW